MRSFFFSLSFAFHWAVVILFEMNKKKLPSSRCRCCCYCDFFLLFFFHSLSLSLDISFRHHECVFVLEPSVLLMLWDCFDAAVYACVSVWITSVVLLKVIRSHFLSFFRQVSMFQNISVICLYLCFWISHNSIWLNECVYVCVASYIRWLFPLSIIGLFVRSFVHILYRNVIFFIFIHSKDFCTQSKIMINLFLLFRFIFRK